MPPYDPTVWIEDQTKLGPTNMNHIEQGIADVEANAQPLDADLTTIAGLSPTNDDFLQRKDGAWTNRSPVQAKADLGLVLNAYDYGVRFDDAIDTATETAAWQAVFDALIPTSPTDDTDPGGMIVAIPPAGYGRSVIDDTITVKSGSFWKLYAPGLTFVQDTDNTPHLTVTNNAPYVRSSAGWVIEGPTWFTWTNQQATTVATQGVLSGTGTGTFTVASSTPFPSGAITVLIEKEQITGSFSGNTFTATARGDNNTTAVSHTVGSTVYPVGRTDACAVFLPDDATHEFYHNFVIEKVAFDNGSYLLGCETTNTNVWGWTLRDVYVHLNAVGGLVSNADTSGGQPNNKIEGAYVLANSMVGPILDLQGNHSAWFTGIEINNSWLSPIIIRSGSGSSINIGTLKSELGVYDNRNTGTMFQLANESFTAQFIQLVGMNIDTASMTLPYIFSRFGGTSGKHFHIGTLNFEGDFFTTSADPSGQVFNGWTIKNTLGTGNSNYYAVNGNTSTTQDTGTVYINNLRGMPARSFYLTNAVSSASNAAAQDAVCVVDAIRGRVSGDKANSDYTWGPLGARAQCLLKLSSGTNPADGDTVVLGGYQGVSRTYRFKNTLAAVGDVKIGANFAETLANLSNAVNGDGTPGTDYFTGTFALPFVTGGPQTVANGVNAENSATMNVADGSALPTSGSFMLGGVRTTYTGRTSNQLTGCGNHAATVGGETISGFVASTAGAEEQAKLTFAATPGTLFNQFPCTSTGSVLLFRDAADSANKTVFSGGTDTENVVCYETNLTAARTVTLTTSFTGAQTNLFNGAKVRIVRTAGGAFDLIINRGTTELTRIYSGQTGSVEFTFRRGQWVQTADNRTAAATMSTPADPTGTTDTTGKMMGLAGAITPVKTGKVHVTVNGDILNATGIGDGAKVRIRYGTGSAPSNGDALGGTTIGTQVQYVASTTAGKAPFSISGLITGATVGTALWLDVGLAAITAGTAQIENVTVTAIEVG